MYTTHSEGDCSWLLQWRGRAGEIIVSCEDQIRSDGLSSFLGSWTANQLKSAELYNMWYMIKYILYDTYQYHYYLYSLPKATIHYNHWCVWNPCTEEIMHSELVQSQSSNLYFFKSHRLCSAIIYVIIVYILAMENDALIDTTFSYLHFINMIWSH